MAEVLLNQEQIKEIIPHRDPFLLIDEVPVHGSWKESRCQKVYQGR